MAIHKDLELSYIRTLADAKAAARRVAENHACKVTRNLASGAFVRLDELVAHMSSNESWLARDD